ncbi:MAG: hypothetical protein WBX11_19225, partial [Thiobacillaceae bacterium]
MSPFQVTDWLPFAPPRWYPIRRHLQDGTQREFILLKESDTPIQRHVKIKAEANPHDPKWEPYFESR